MFGLSFQELLIVGVVAILLFGKNLPEVARKFGAMYRDLRKSLDELRAQVDFTEAFNSTPARPRPRPTFRDDEADEVSAPKFIPPPAPPEPVESVESAEPPRAA